MKNNANHKRIIIAIPSLSKGSGLSRYVFSLAEILINNGFQVTVLATHEQPNDDFGRSELHKINPRIQYKPFFNNESILKRYLKVLLFIRNQKPAFLINNYNGLVQRLLPFLSRTTRNIHLLHNDAPDFYRMGELNGSRVNEYIAPTQAIADHFNEYTSGRFAGKVSVIPHGVHEAEISNPIRGQNKHLSLLYVGVLSTHKGAQYLYPITQILKSKGINFSLTIIGTGFLEAEMKDQFNEDIQAGIVRMTGVIAHEEVYQQMSQADIFLYPTNCDAFGLVIAEAMMNGAVPVVGLLPGITDNLIEEGNEGFLVDPLDYTGFAERIEKLDADRKLLTEMSQRSYNTAKNKFSDRVMTEHYLSFLNNLI